MADSTEEEDLTDKYNTPLTPEEETRYQAWAKQNHREGDTFDYDMRGAWKEGIVADPSTGHFPDTYKKPNHPTFSDQSQYHGADGRMGGHWKYDETGTETLQPYSQHYAAGGKVEPYEQPYQGPHNVPYGKEDETLEEDAARADKQLRDERDAARKQSPAAGPSIRQNRGLYFGNLDTQPRDREAPELRYEQGGKVEKIQQQMDDPEHGSWHDDGQHQIYTPHPSFFAEVEPQELVDHFDQHHPKDHRLNLP